MGCDVMVMWCGVMTWHGIEWDAMGGEVTVNTPAPVGHNRARVVCVRACVRGVCVCKDDAM